RHLDLDGNSLGPDGVAALAKSRYLKSLYQLRLGDSEPGKSGLRALAKADLPNLHILHLFPLKQQDDSALGELANSASLPRLLMIGANDNVDTVQELEALGRTVGL